MSKRIAAAAVMASIFGITTSAMAGTTGTFTFFPSDVKVTEALSDPVTYSIPASGKKPAMQTYIGIRVGDAVTGLLMKNTSGNTANNVSFTFTVTVTDPNETITLYQPEFYLPAGCSWDNTAANAKSFICNLGQLKNGSSVSAFTVFYVAPQKVCQTVGSNPCGGADDAENSDFVKTDLRVFYAEGLNGPPPVEGNSNQIVSQIKVVTLGTSNPVNIKLAVPKNGANVFTGSGGAPVPETQTPPIPNSEFAEVLKVPSLSPTYKYSVAEIVITSVKDVDLAECQTGGHFKACPTFTTSVKSDGVETRFLDPANPLRFLYRIDASNLKLSGPKILNSATILYSGKRYDPDTNLEVATPPGPWVEKKVDVCVNGQPSKDGLPCIESSKCYKKNDTGGIADLEGDCEWTLINTGNGLGKLQ